MNNLKTLFVCLSVYQSIYLPTCLSQNGILWLLFWFAWAWFNLISLFNDISTLVGYFYAEAILIEQSSPLSSSSSSQAHSMEFQDPLSRYPSLSSIVPGWSSWLHPLSTLSRPTLTCSCVGAQKRTSLMISSLFSPAVIHMSFSSYLNVLSCARL